ncbi:hypothetical protein M514_20251, partial [Trichuris suis]
MNTLKKYESLSLHRLEDKLKIFAKDMRVGAWILTWRYSQLAACFTCTTNVVSIMWHKAFILLAMMQKLDMKVPFAYPIHDMVANKQLS